MGAAGLVLALALPWIAGTVWVRLGWRERRPGWRAVAVGYGFAAGMLATTGLLRGFDAIGLGVSFGPTASTLVALSALAIVLARRRSAAAQRDSGDPTPAGERGDATADPPRAATPPSRRATSRAEGVAAALLAWFAALRLLGLGLESLWRPLYFWDAWATWAVRARVWFEQGRLVPFVAPEEWASRLPGAWTVEAWFYPETVSLLPLWTSLGMGRWDDALMNLPWTACALALALALYGQARLWGVGALGAAAGAYALVSLPLLDTQVALPGAADLWQAAVYGLAGFAFALWWRDRDPRQGLLALLLALACPLVKQPGLAWMLSFAVPLVLGRRAPGRALLLGAVSAAVLLAGLATTGAPLRLQPGAAEALAESLFTLASWHLFWYAWLALAVFGGARALREPALRPLALLAMADLAFLAVAYLLTPRGRWALDYTQVNRGLLHVVPLLLFSGLLLADALWRDAARAEAQES